MKSPCVHENRALCIPVVNDIHVVSNRNSNEFRPKMENTWKNVEIMKCVRVCMIRCVNCDIESADRRRKKPEKSFPYCHDRQTRNVCDGWQIFLSRFIQVVTTKYVDVRLFIVKNTTTPCMRHEDKHKKQRPCVLVCSPNTFPDVDMI